MNGEVECFTGGHIALGMLAILVLLAALLLIPCIILVATGRLKAVSITIKQRHSDYSYKRSFSSGIYIILMGALRIPRFETRLMSKGLQGLLIPCIMN